MVRNAYFRGKYGDKIRAVKNARAAGNAKKVVVTEPVNLHENYAESEESDSDYLYVDDDVNELTLDEKMDRYFNSLEDGEKPVGDQNHACTQTDEIGLLITQIPSSFGSLSEVATFLEKHGRLISVKVRDDICYMKIPSNLLLFFKADKKNVPLCIDGTFFAKRSYFVCFRTHSLPSFLLLFLSAPSCGRK